jgi:phosphoribosylamine--glycine ligase
MKILVLGGGGREHALGWTLARSAREPVLLFAPGNAGTATLGTNVKVAAGDLPAVRDLCRREKPDLVVVGPEDPLVAGVADVLQADGFKVFGPSAAGAAIEGSKSLAKSLMSKYLVPTAAYRVFTDAGEARRYARNSAHPLVVKADGLCAGKGVIVCDSAAEAVEAVDAFMVEKRFGEAGAKIVVEERLTGREASVMALTDGRTVAVLEAAQDHKRIFDGDRGPNTGGMGAFSPAPAVTPRVLDVVERDVLVPIVHGLGREKRPYRGLLYAGLMITKGGVRVIEFNCRFGDPETQAVLPRLKSDLAELLLATAEGRLDECVVEWDPRPSVCVVMAAENYPGTPRRGDEIFGLDRAEAVPGVTVFHAGTEDRAGRAFTNGGRVLGVTALGKDVAAARDAAYAAVGEISFPGAQYRRDIAEGS